jgi:hypothetical protein
MRQEAYTSMLLRWAKLKLKLKPWRLRVLGLFMVSLMLVIFFLPPSIFGTVLLGFLAAFLVIDGCTAKPEMFGNSRAQFIIVSIMGAAVWLKADRGVEIEYYKAAAQALPVLLLAFVIEKRSGYHAGADVLQRVTMLIVIVYLVAASFITFSVLAYKDAKGWPANWVTAAFAASVMSLGLSLLKRPREASQDHGGAVASDNLD